MFFQAHDQNLSEYYTIVPEISHKGSELQVLIADGTFTWNSSNIQQIEENLMLNATPPTHQQSSSRNSICEIENFDEIAIAGNNQEDVSFKPLLKNISFHIKKVSHFLLMIVKIF